MTPEPEPTAYAGIVREILVSCGGKANIENVAHCATRLRLAFRDRSAVDADRLSRCPGLAGILKRGDGLHLVFGVEVVYIYREFMQALSPH